MCSWERTFPQPPAELQRGPGAEASPSRAARTPLRAQAAAGGSLKTRVGSNPAADAAAVPSPAGCPPERAGSQQGCAQAPVSTASGPNLSCPRHAVPYTAPVLAPASGRELNDPYCTGWMDVDSRLQTRNCAQVSAHSPPSNARPCGAHRCKCTPQADTYMNIV